MSEFNWNWVSQETPYPNFGTQASEVDAPCFSKKSDAFLAWPILAKPWKYWLSSGSKSFDHIRYLMING